MNLKISTRRQFLSKKKENGNRITIGFTGIADLRSFIALEYISGMMKACEDYDINFINLGGAVKYSLFDDINFIQTYMKNFKFMKSPFLDGIITWTSSFWDFLGEEKIIKTFSELAPLPMVDIGYMNIPNASHLKINGSAAMEMIMSHLINEHKYTKFAFFGADVSEPHWNRLFNYQKELKKHNIQELPDSVYMAKSMSSKHIAEKVEELIQNHVLHKKQEIDVIITTTDIVAAELIEVLNRKGISVPKDVAITGFNNWYEGITSRSPLTTIDLSYYKRGYSAVENLIDKIIRNENKEKYDENETILFSPKLIIRQSCGCLEQSVKAAKFVIDDKSIQSEINDESSEEDIRHYLMKYGKQILASESEENLEDLMNAFFEDIYTDNKKESKLLLWVQDVLQNRRKSKTFDSDIFQNAISDFRKLLLPILKTEKTETVFKIEDIFHQMRTLVSVFQKYDTLADRENPYQMNNISNHAISFFSAQTVDDIFEILKTQFSQFDVPSAIIALSDKPTKNLPITQIKMIYPEHKNYDDSDKALLEEKITEPHLFPKNYFPKNRRYSMILEMLHHTGSNFGYAFFEMKKINIVQYDVLRMLISNALNIVYDKIANNKNNSFELSQNQINSVIEKTVQNPSLKERTRITVEKITSYLTAEIGKKTDLEKMAKHFMVSKSYLSKKTKELTGHSVQILHERLKIEQAKNMLLTNEFDFYSISNMLGFSNQNYFSNVFKKNTGLSPKNWLKINQ